jgi:hypothetical protein
MCVASINTEENQSVVIPLWLSERLAQTLAPHMYAFFKGHIQKQKKPCRLQGFFFASAITLISSYLPGDNSFVTKVRVEGSDITDCFTVAKLIFFRSILFT